MKGNCLLWGKKFHFHHCKLKPCCRWLLATEFKRGSVYCLWELSWVHPFPRKVLECKLCPSNVGGNCIVLCLRCCWWVCIPKQATPVFRCSRIELGKYNLILLMRLWSRLLWSFSLWLIVHIRWNIFPSENFWCDFFFFPSPPPPDINWVTKKTWSSWSNETVTCTGTTITFLCWRSYSKVMYCAVSIQGLMLSVSIVKI